MALKRECDSPGCETSLDVDADELEDLPAGWWVLERAEAVGTTSAQYTLCSLSCVGAVAEMFDDEHAAPVAGDEDAS